VHFSLTYRLLTFWRRHTHLYVQVEVFWVVTPCSVAVGYQHFRGPCCLHLQALFVSLYILMWTQKFPFPSVYGRAEKPINSSHPYKRVNLAAIKIWHSLCGCHVNLAVWTKLNSCIQKYHKKLWPWKLKSYIILNNSVSHFLLSSLSLVISKRLVLF
jgi:hypothetical protein